MTSGRQVPREWEEVALLECPTGVHGSTAVPKNARKPLFLNPLCFPGFSAVTAVPLPALLLSSGEYGRERLRAMSGVGTGSVHGLQVRETS